MDIKFEFLLYAISILFILHLFSDPSHIPELKQQSNVKLNNRNHRSGHICTFLYTTRGVWSLWGSILSADRPLFTSVAADRSYYHWMCGNVYHNIFTAPIFVGCSIRQMSTYSLLLKLSLFWHIQPCCLIFTLVTLLYGFSALEFSLLL